MVQILDKERNLFIGIFIALSIFFLYLIDVFASFFSNNFLVGYAAFVGIYVYLVLKYVLEIKLTPEHYIAFVMIFLALDIILYPILIPKEGPPMLTFSQSLSSDVFIYSLLPTSLPHIARYYITYVIVPTLLLIGARLLTGRKRFATFVRENA